MKPISTHAERAESVRSERDRYLRQAGSKTKAVGIDLNGGSGGLSAGLRLGRISPTSTYEEFTRYWQGSSIGTESTLHQLSPYVGKVKSSMAEALVSTFTQQGEVIYDPFCGSGTIPLEAWIARRNVIANDISAYASVLTRAKLNPPNTLEEVMLEMNEAHAKVNLMERTISISEVPQWVRAFFNDRTLREVIAWARVLRDMRSHFILSCLLGILHHQRPGFLSYPSSHSTPYLRDKLFPRDRYPELYEYRPVRERLERKIQRALRRVPPFDYDLRRYIYSDNAATLIPNSRINAIITSPPYMKQLDYGRDNRLRLWFLGKEDWRSINEKTSPSKSNFLKLMRVCLQQWHKLLVPEGLCILIVGQSKNGNSKTALSDIVELIATNKPCAYQVLQKHEDDIPDNRRVRRSYRGSNSETIIVLRKI